MKLQIKVLLFDARGDKDVEAILRPVRFPSDQVLWYEWLPYMYNEMQEPMIDQFPDLAWFPEFQVGYRSMLDPSTEKHAQIYIMEKDTSLQGFIRIISEAKDPLQSKSVYVQFLATAPWNRGVTRRFKYVGQILMSWAIIISYAKGYRGRIFLESIPKAAKFYQRIGMHQVGISSFKLPVFLFDENEAIQFLNKNLERFIVS